MSLNKDTTEEEKEAIKKLRKDNNKRIKELKYQIKRAKHDQKHCDRDYARLLVEETKEKYEEILSKEEDLENR